jgi:trk system potassium uptake protein TrkA
MKIIIIGCGRLGSGLAKNLSLQGLDVVVIDQDPNAFLRLGPTFKGRTVKGIGFDEKVLLDAGIKTADALAAVTQSDEVNLVAARLAKVIFKVPKVAARVYDPRKAKIYQRLGLQTISPIGLGIDRFANLLVNAYMGTEKSIGAGQLSLMDVEVSGNMIGRPISEINLADQIQVIAITRNGKTFIPNPATHFQLNDLVHISVTRTSIDRLERLLH